MYKYVVIILFVSLYTLSHVWNFYHVPNDNSALAITQELQQNEDTALTERQQEPLNSPFDDLSIQARSAIVIDVKTGKVLYGLHEESQLPLASLTKIMSALIAREYLPEDTIISINKQAYLTEGDSGFYLNENWKLNDLIAFSLIVSSNEGMRAIANTHAKYYYHVTNDTTPFVDAMNKKAEELLMSQTFYLNATGLDTNQGVSGSYGSAKDTALLFRYILQTYPDLLLPTSQKVVKFYSLNDYKHTATNTNKIVDKVPGLYASKTGYTDLAGGNLAVAFNAGLNHPLIAIILGSTKEGRFSDMEKLVWTSIEAINQGF